MSEQDSNDNVSPLDLILSKSIDELQPWETCYLPSKGYYYNGLVPNGAVKVRPLNIHSEKIMATQRLAKSGEAIEHLFKNHVWLPNDFNSLDLLETDREYIIYYLRGITHGNEYEFLLTCPQCGKTSDQLYDLNELYNTARFPNEKLGVEPFKIILPHFSEVVGEDFWVKVRFLRGRDALEMLGANVSNDLKMARSKAKKTRSEAMEDAIKERGSNLNETLERNINRIIVEVMGETNRSKINKLVERMHSKDVNAILDFLNDNTPGIDNSIEAECGNSACSAVFNVQLPITDQFFRPKRRSNSRE